jgi:hypothetical protein
MRAGNAATFSQRWTVSTTSTSTWSIAGKQAGTERLIGLFATRTQFGLWFRDLAMRTMNFGPVAALFSGSVRDDIELPDYTF